MKTIALLAFMFHLAPSAANKTGWIWGTIDFGRDRVEDCCNPDELATIDQIAAESIIALNQHFASYTFALDELDGWRRGLRGQQQQRKLPICDNEPCMLLFGGLCQGRRELEEGEEDQEGGMPQRHLSLHYCPQSQDYFENDFATRLSNANLSTKCSKKLGRKNNTWNFSSVVE